METAFGSFLFAFLGEFSYLCDGTKLRAVSGATTYDYLDGNVYVDGRLESAPFAEGRWVTTTGTSGRELKGHIYVRDHLGSTRAIVANGVPIDGKDYLPFGKPWERADAPTSDNRYLFNGKESQAHVGFDYLDYGARNYDPDLGRWTTIDPLVEKYYGISPYAYVANNPIKYIDPDGRIIRVHDFADNQIIAYDWREHAGEWGFYNNDNAIYAGANAFIGQLSAALAGLMNGGQAGRDLVSGLANHSNVVIMMQANRSVADHQNQIGWNPTGVQSNGSLEQVRTTDGLRSDPMMTLGHELGHVEYNWSGGETKTWFNMQTSEKGSTNVSISEIHSMHRENQMRSENGLPLRTHYGVDANGFGYGPRIVVPRTGASKYHNSKGETNYRPLKKDVEPFIY